MFLLIGPHEKQLVMSTLKSLNNKFVVKAEAEHPIVISV